MSQDVGNLLTCLGMMRCVELPDSFDEWIQRQTRRLPRGTWEDFLSLVLLECLEEDRREGKLTAQIIRRIVWRVQKRVARELQRERSCSLDDRAVESRQGVMAQSEGLAAQREELERLLALLTPQEAIVLQSLLDGWSQRQIASAIKCSEAKISRLRSSIRLKLGPWLDPDGGG